MANDGSKKGAGPKRTRGRIGADFSLGAEQAEADPLLEAAFYESGDYSVIESRAQARCFIIGRTGGGKSAALQHLEDSYHDHVIRITPEDLSLPYITDLSVIRHLDSLDVHLDSLFIALWKHVLLVEVIRHRYNIDSPAAKQNFLATLREKVKRDPAKAAALEYLDEYEGKFWCETDERVREITQRFEEQIDNVAKGQLSLGSAGVEVGRTHGKLLSTEVRSEHAERYQRIVNNTQLARLNKMIAVLNEDILDEPQHYTYVIIDDLDRDWVDERVANDLIRCLFRTVLDLKRVRNLRVLVALRTNIFQELRFSERASGQEEKLRALVLPLRWTKHDLESMLDERTRAAAELGSVPNIDRVADLLPTANRNRGNPVDFILDRTLMRPRDAIAFVNEALNLSRGKTRISWAELVAAERPYSQNRLLALRDEWSPTYPDLIRVIEVFRKAPLPMSRDEFRQRVDEAILLMADPTFRGVLWVTEMAEPVWQSSISDEWADQYGPFTSFLYNIGLIGVAPSRGHRPTFSYEIESYPSNLANLGPDSAFFVHRTFQPALNITIDAALPDL